MSVESATAVTQDRPRDESGRFTSAETASSDAEEAAVEEQVDVADEALAESTTDAPETAEPTGTDTAATEAPPSEVTTEDISAEAQSTAEVPEATPFSFRADGNEIAVEGATVRGDEIVISREAWQRSVQPYLADRRGWERERSKLQQQLRAADPERNATVVKASVLLSKLDAIHQALAKGDEAPLVDLIQNFHSGFTAWQTEAENEALKRQVKYHSESQEAETRQQQAAELLPQLQNGLKANVESLIAAEFKGLGFKAEEVAADLWELYERGAPVFVDLRDPQAAARHGVAPDIYVDNALVQRYLDRPARVIRDREAAAKAKAAAAKQNAAVLQPKKAAPVVTAKGSPEPGGRDIDPSRAKSKEEYEKLLKEKYGGIL